ncbi:MAG: hypothetical protein ACRC33_20175 [Gemmataceae bacterium]
MIRLHHGTDASSAHDTLVNGIQVAGAAAFNVSGEFWATTSAADAETFAQVNPAGGVPARFSFDLPVSVLQALLAAAPPRAYQHTSAGVDWYEFLPDGFPLLNQRLTNRQVVSPVP